MSQSKTKTMPEAQRIISDYAQTRSTVAFHNLYLAATELEQAYSALKAECDKWKEEVRFLKEFGYKTARLLVDENAALIAENLKLQNYNSELIEDIRINERNNREHSEQQYDYKVIRTSEFNLAKEKLNALTLENTEFRAALEYYASEQHFCHEELRVEDGQIARAVLSKHDKKENKP